MVLRARIILLRSEGLSKERTARKLGVSEVTVQTWTDRFRKSGIDGLVDKPGRGRKPSIDEKTQCQALERTQPGLPLGIGHIRTKSHDYIRHGTTTLFAALEYASGKVIHAHHQTHTHKEWLSFLKQIWRIAPKDVSIEIVADNYATHKHADVTEWLKKHPRVHMHYTPTSSSWLNLVERFFGEITRDCIRDGSFTSVAQLEKSISDYIANLNKNPKRFVWKAGGAKILEKINRARSAIGMTSLPEAGRKDNAEG